MKWIMRCLSKVADSSSYRHLSKETGRLEVSEGHVPVYVGEEMEWFEVRADLLSRPVFLELLDRSAEMYGYDQRGVLQIPCSVPHFHRVLQSLLSQENHDAGKFLSGDDDAMTRGL